MAQVFKYFFYWFCSCLNVNKCGFPEAYLLKYSPSSFIVTAIVLLKILNVFLFHCWFYASFNLLSVLILFRKWWHHQNVRCTMGFTYFVVEVLLRITEMFIHVKTSENCFFSIVQGFHAHFDQKSSYGITHFCFFRRSTVVILLLFLSVTGISQQVWFHLNAD